MKFGVAVGTKKIAFFGFFFGLSLSELMKCSWNLQDLIVWVPMVKLKRPEAF